MGDTAETPACSVSVCCDVVHLGLRTLALRLSTHDMQADLHHKAE